MNTAELNAIKEKMKDQIGNRESVNAETVKIVVGMGTCGLAAGAREVLNVLVDEVAKLNLNNVKVLTDGCVGACNEEPIVTVCAPGKDKVSYGKVDASKAKEIVKEHIVNGKVVQKYVIGK